MRIITIGRGSIGGTLARLWTAAGHEVTSLGRDGGDATDAEVVLLAVPYDSVTQALSQVVGLDGKIVLDATNRIGTGTPPAGYSSTAEYVKAQTGGPTAKVFNLNFAALFDRAAAASSRPNNIWVGDDDTRTVVDQLSHDVGMQAVNGGPLEYAAIQEDFAKMFVKIVSDGGEGLLFYRFASPETF